MMGMCASSGKFCAWDHDCEGLGGCGGGGGSGASAPELQVVGRVEGWRSQRTAPWEGRSRQ